METNVALIAASLAAPPVGLPAPATAQTPVEAVSAIFKDLNDSGPGCSVAAAEADRRLVTRAYGMANLEHNVAITPASVLEAGSISKQITAAAIMLLVQDGKLSLDDDARRHLPELSHYREPMTIHHLLTHTSGLRDWGDMSQIAGWRLGTRVFGNADVLRFLARQRSLNFRPGDHFEYTGSGYVALAEIVRRLSGKSLPEFTKERIFQPLRMASTQWRDDFRRVVKRRATAYRKVDDEYVAYMPFTNVIGPDGLLTTTSDLLLWNRALDAGTMGAAVTAELEREARDNSGRALGYGRGLWVDRHRGYREISHGGMTGGFQATLLRYPERQLSVALLCNGFHITSNDFGHSLADLYLPARENPPRKDPDPTAGQATAPSAISAAELASLRGTWVDEAASRFVDAEYGEGFTWGGKSFQALGPGRFYREDWGEIILRTPDRLDVIRLDGERARYVRVKGEAPTRSALGKLAGSYRSQELQASYEASLVDGKIHLVNSETGFNFTVTPVGGPFFRAPGAVVRFERGQGGCGKLFVLGVRRARVTFQREGAACS